MASGQEVCLNWQILFGHVLRNCRGPLVTLIGISFGSMLGGTTIVESIFSWPGVGQIGSRCDYSQRLSGDTELCCLDGSYLSEYQLSD